MHSFEFLRFDTSTMCSTGASCLFPSVMDTVRNVSPEQSPPSEVFPHLDPFHFKLERHESTPKPSLLRSSFPRGGKGRDVHKLLRFVYSPNLNVNVQD